MKATALLFLAVGLAGCTGLYGHDEFATYTERKDTMTMGAGDAVRQNMVTHTLNPWPPGVGDRRIPMNGAKAARAIDCYERGGNAAGASPVTNTQTSTISVGGASVSGSKSTTSNQC